MSNEIQKHPAYRRVLLKISGEALVGEQTFGIDVKVAHSVAEEIKQVHNLGVELAVVVGGGNIFRGLSKSAGSMDRSAADYIGMLATVMNAVVLQDALERTGIQTRVPIPSFVTTRAMLPDLRMLKTTIGKLLSMHREIADASITFSCFSRTSR